MDFFCTERTEVLSEISTYLEHIIVLNIFLTGNLGVVVLLAFVPLFLEKLLSLCPESSTSPLMHTETTASFVLAAAARTFHECI
jgi:hypothetical protein